ncbi:hypothetical protein B0O99DRAFT_680904 [Bisporella sp. PMI_857]|nr:hypothetical protein B0O99DRAFT_680904 [Bisporella sp. PMI_857]
MGAKADFQIPTSSPSTCKRYSLVLIAALAFTIIYSLRASFPTVPPLPNIHPEHAIQSSSPHPPTTAIDSTNIAVIIEDRPLPKLAPLLLHFSSVLGPAWPIILYTTRNQHSVPKSAPFRRAISEGRILIRHVPFGIQFSRQQDIAEFMTLPWLWEHLAPAEHVLVFQADSIICANSALKVDDFLQYDFIGAPIDPRSGLGQGFNGGFSLRKRTMMLDIVTRFHWLSERNQAINSHSENLSVNFEDQWFYKKMRELPSLPDGSPAANLPTIDMAKTFSVETLWHDSPLGFHQVERWHTDKMDKVDEWCPEHKLSTPEMLVREGSLRD